MVVSSAVGCLVFALHFRKKDSLCRFVRPERREGDPGLLRVWLLWGSRPVWGSLIGEPWFAMGIRHSRHPGRRRLMPRRAIRARTSGAQALKQLAADGAVIKGERVGPHRLRPLVALAGDEDGVAGVRPQERLAYRLAPVETHEGEG